MKFVATSLLLLASLLGGGVAPAHPSITSGPATASKSNMIAFGVSHGCEGVDTFRVRVVIPAGVTSVRALRSDFGKPSLEKTGDVVTAVVWEKLVDDVQDED